MESKASSGTTSLKNLRTARSLSQGEVAEAIGTNANTVSRWERGVANPSPHYRRKLADYFGIDPQELFADINSGEVTTTPSSSDAKPSSPEPVEKGAKEDAGPIGTYFNLDITITTGSSVSPTSANSRGKDYSVTATFAKSGEACATMQFPFDQQTLAERLTEVKEGLSNVPADKRVSLSEKEQRIQIFGRELFNALFYGDVYTLYEKAKRELNRANDERLRIRLCMHSPELTVLPWELMYDPHAASYLCLERSISLVRYQESEDSYSPLQVELPLNILGMAAIPKHQGKLDIQIEKRALKTQLKSLSQSMKLSWLSGSSWDDLRKAMGRGPWHIFHFIGHGSFNTSTKEGFITLVDTKDNPVSINARDLSLLLDQPSLRLVVLNICSAAFGNCADGFSGVASVLAQRNIPAVIAIQYQITDKASIKFAHVFYRTLVKGEAIDAALTEARLALKGISFSLEWAVPVLHMRSCDGNLFTLASEPLTIPSPLPEPDKTTETLPLESQVVVNPSTPESDKPVSPENPLRPPLSYKISLKVYILIASIIIFPLILGGFFVHPSLLSKPSPDPFPVLCSGNFQSTDTSIVPTPTTSTSSDGEPIGLSEGANIFDLQRPNQQEVQYKLRAAQATTNNPQDVVSSLQNALSIDQTDAEAQIYLENWRVLGSNHPHITFVVGVNLAGGSSSTLQGAFTAQKECNNHSQQDSSKTQVVLMIANIGGNNPDDRAKSATFVANQIVDQAAKDPTIVAIMGWPVSADSINVSHQLKIRGSLLPMVSSSSASDELEGMSNFFRICSTNREQTQMAVSFLLNTKLKKRIAILYDQTTSYANNLKSDFAADIQNNMVGLESYAGGDPKALLSALNKALDQRPDAIFFSGYTSDLVILLNDISSIPQAKNLLIVGGDALASTNSYTTPLPDMQNVYFTAFASPNEWESINPKPPFFQEYQANFGTLMSPNGLPSIDASVMLSYDAMLTLLYGSGQVLSAKNTINSSDLTQALKQITLANPIQGVTGRIAFDSNGDQYRSKVIFVEHIEGSSLKLDEKWGCLQKDKCGS
jgi:ABC-type branched-subunit amino acid transport system substrate-binding protein/DNA-binding XRE family transcriptional regulator